MLTSFRIAAQFVDGKNTIRDGGSTARDQEFLLSFASCYPWLIFGRSDNRVFVAVVKGPGSRLDDKMLDSAWCFGKEK